MKWLFEAHKQIVKPLSQTCATHIWRACAARKVRVCAYSEVLSVHLRLCRLGWLVLIFNWLKSSRRITKRFCANMSQYLRFPVFPSRSWQLPLSGRETARENKKNLRSAQDHKWSLDSGELDNNSDLFAMTSTVQSLLALVCAWLWRCRCYRWVTPLFGLATLESAILAIDGPKMKNSTTLGFLCNVEGWRWREVRLPVETQPF